MTKEQIMFLVNMTLEKPPLEKPVGEIDIYWSLQATIQKEIT
jgi:hypothetical protein